MIHTHPEHLGALVGRSLQNKRNPECVVQILVPYFHVEPPPPPGLNLQVHGSARERVTLCAVVVTALGEVWATDVNEHWVLLPEELPNQVELAKKKTRWWPW